MGGSAASWAGHARQGGALREGSILTRSRRNDETGPVQASPIENSLRFFVTPNQNKFKVRFDVIGRQSKWDAAFDFRVPYKPRSIFGQDSIDFRFAHSRFHLSHSPGKDLDGVGPLLE